MTRSLLTSTRLINLRRCPRQHYLRYELGLSKVREATPLRFGRGFHYGLELYNARISSDMAVECVTADYRTCPDWADPTDWTVEGETLQSLLLGHFWRYQDDDIDFVAAEQSFEMLKVGGTATLVGMVPFGEKIELHGADFLRERRIQGSSMGSNRFRRDMPHLIELYLQGRLHLDDWISDRIKIEEINEGFTAMKEGRTVRSLIDFGIV